MRLVIFEFILQRTSMGVWHRRQVLENIIKVGRSLGKATWEVWGLQRSLLNISRFVSSETNQKVNKRDNHPISSLGRSKGPLSYKIKSTDRSSDPPQPSDLGGSGPPQNPKLGAYGVWSILMRKIIVDIDRAEFIFVGPRNFVIFTMV